MAFGQRSTYRIYNKLSIPITFLYLRDKVLLKFFFRTATGNGSSPCTCTRWKNSNNGSYLPLAAGKIYFFHSYFVTEHRTCLCLILIVFVVFQFIIIFLCGCDPKISGRIVTEMNGWMELPFVRWFKIFSPNGKTINVTSPRFILLGNTPISFWCSSIHTHTHTHPSPT